MNNPQESVNIMSHYVDGKVIANPLVFLLDIEDFNMSNKYTPISLKFNTQSQKEPFFKKGSPPAKSIVSISENMRQIYKATAKNEGTSTKKITTNIIFSPCFQCYTSLPFHGALLKELKMMAKRVDNGDSKCRYLIWQQLFILVGVDKEAEDPISDVLDSILSQEKMNLIELEVMYLSFLLCLRLYPSILDPNEKGESLIRKDGKLKEKLQENATEFFKTLQSQLPSIHVPFFQELQKSLMSNSSPKYILQQHTAHLNLAQQFKQLKTWAPKLDTLSSEVIKILKEVLEDSKKSEKVSFVSLFNEWEKDISNHKNEVEKMYITIIKLNETGVLSGFVHPTFLSRQIEDIVKTAPSPIWPYNPNHVFNLPTSPIPIPTPSPLPSPFRSIPVYPLQTNVIKPTVLQLPSQEGNSPFTPKSKDSNSPRIIFSENSSFEKKSSFTSPQKKRGAEDVEQSQSKKIKK